jgi:TnpA family transposase
MMWLIGFRFAPRIRDLADKHLYVPAKDQFFHHWSGSSATRYCKLFADQWQEVLRMAASIRLFRKREVGAL